MRIFSGLFSLPSAIFNQKFFLYNIKQSTNTQEVIYYGKKYVLFSV